MKVIGIIIQVFAYIATGCGVFLFGIIPAFGRMWTWGYHGIGLLISLLVAGLLFGLSGWLKDKAREKAKQNSDSK